MSSVVTVVQQQLPQLNRRYTLFGGCDQHHIGDVLFVKRNLIPQITCYHHAGVVTQVNEDGSITTVLHFDLVFDSAREINPETIKRAINGCSGEPQSLEGFEKINSRFPLGSTFVHKRGVRAEEESILRRIQHAEKRRHHHYLLLEYNCQSFAMYISTGTAESKDLDSLVQALQDFFYLTFKQQP